MTRMTVDEYKRMKPKRSKYGNQPAQRIVNGNIIKFPSAKEAAHFDELRMLLDIGQIQDLRLQHHFTLTEAYTAPDGVKVGAVKYIADFTYRKGADLYVVDVKGCKTKEYAIKKKMMLDKYGISVMEV